MFSVTISDPSCRSPRHSAPAPRPPSLSCFLPLGLGCRAPGTPGPCSGGARSAAGLGVETWHPAGARGAFGEGGLRQAGSERWPHGDRGALMPRGGRPLSCGELAWPASAGEDHALSFRYLRRTRSCGIAISVNSRMISYRYCVHDVIYICFFEYPLMIEL